MALIPWPRWSRSAGVLQERDKPRLSLPWKWESFKAKPSDLPEAHCAVTLASSDTSVVDFLTNSTTGARVPQAKGVGAATITINVQGFTGNVPAVPVTVTGVGN